MSPGVQGSAAQLPDVDAVTALVEHVARTVVTPRFRDLLDGEVGEKSPGDLVTVVDTEAEAALTRGLAELAPGIPVVGEEAASADSGVLAALEADRVWVVDPLDGTRAFVQGSPDHAVMVALVERGEAVAGWICLPQHGQTYVAERGAGAYLNSERLVRPAPPSGPVRGAIATSHLPPDVRAAVLARIAARPECAGVVTAGALWAGREYTRLASGERDVMLHWRTWPWDHAPGAVLVREVGGVSRRLDGSEYSPSSVSQGLVTAADEATWEAFVEALGLRHLPV